MCLEQEFGKCQNLKTLTSNILYYHRLSASSLSALYSALGYGSMSVPNIGCCHLGSALSAWLYLYIQDKKMKRCNSCRTLLS